MTDRMFVCGLRGIEAETYCKENNLGFPQTFILLSEAGLRGVRRGTLKLVGRFHERPDREVILTMAQSRGFTIEDCTA